MDKYEKFPKWLKDDIFRLKNKIKSLEIENNTLRGEHPESNTCVLWFGSDGSKRQYLKDHQTVFFRGVNDLEVYVQVDLKGTVRVEIEDGVIAPAARNVFHVLDRHNKGDY